MPHMMISVRPFPIEFEKNEEKGDPGHDSHSDHNRWDNLVRTTIRSGQSLTTEDDVRWNKRIVGVVEVSLQWQHRWRRPPPVVRIRAKSNRSNARPSHQPRRGRSRRWYSELLQKGMRRGQKRSKFFYREFSPRKKQLEDEISARYHARN